MKTLSKHTLLWAGAVAFITVWLSATASASNISEIEAMASGTTVTLDSSPVITHIISTPGTYNGLNFYSYSFLAQDSTGSIDIYRWTNSATGYTPTLGDALNLTGRYSPFHQIPEIGTPFAGISVVSSGNPIPAPSVYTIPTLNVPTMPFSIAGYMVEVDNVGIYTDPAATIPASGNWPSASTSFYIKDGSGNIMMLYYWPSSYSIDAAWIGTPIPTGTVDIQGIMSVYNSVAEFTPLSITQIPEPSSFALLGLGLLAGASLRRRA